MAAKKKTIRFEILVNDSGVPQQLTLWTKPEDDRDFMKAVNAGRVVTVFQHNVGTKKDFGIVGFTPEKNATFLVFPKTLEPDEGTKVVGIKYERVAPEAPKGPIFKPKKQRLPGVAMRERPMLQLDTAEKASKQAAKAPKQEAPRLRFTAKVQLVASQTLDIEVEAASKTEATKRLRERANDVAFEAEKATVKRTLTSIKKARAT